MHRHTCRLTEHTDEPHNHPNPPTHPHDLATTESAAGSTAAAASPGAERSPRPTQKRPPPANPTRPPPRACSKAVGEMTSAQQQTRSGLPSGRRCAAGAPEGGRWRAPDDRLKPLPVQRWFKNTGGSRKQSTVPPRAHSSAGSPSGSAAPGLTHVPSTRSQGLFNYRNVGAGAGTHRQTSPDLYPPDSVHTSDGP